MSHIMKEKFLYFLINIKSIKNYIYIFFLNDSQKLCTLVCVEDNSKKLGFHICHIPREILPTTSFIVKSIVFHNGKITSVGCNCVRREGRAKTIKAPVCFRRVFNVASYPVRCEKVNRDGTCNVE